MTTPNTTEEEKRMKIPKAMVLEFQPRLTCSVWIDYIHRCRSKEGLVKQLKQRVRKGDFVGYRLLHIEKEVIGNE